MSLTTRVTNDYLNWTRDADWVLYSANTLVKLVSPNSTTEYDEEVYRSFTLTNPAHESALTFSVKHFWQHTYYGLMKCEIILEKPDASRTTLYSSTAQQLTFYNALSSLNITAYLTQAGTYKLILSGDVQSYFFDPGWYNNEVHGGTVLLQVDDTKPSQITGLSAHAESTSEVHLTWDTDSEATQYYVYYKKATDSTWNYVATNNTYMIKGGLDSGILYDFKVSGYNLSGEGTASSTVQMRPLGTMTQNLSDTATPTESFTKVRVANKTFSEDSSVTEDFSIQKFSSTPTSTAILLVGITGSYVYTFATGLPTGTFDTPEIDFGYPDKEKTLLEVRFGSESETPHTLSVYVSTNSGASWTLVDSDTIYLGKTGHVYPWLTSKRFLIRFSGSGLRLYYYELYANPAGWSVKLP